MHHPLGAAIKLGWNSLRQRSYLRDAHLTFSLSSRSRDELPHFVRHRHMPDMDRCRRCEVPSRDGYFLETSARCPHVVVMMPSPPTTLFAIDVAEAPLRHSLHRFDGNTGTGWKHSSFTQSEPELPSLTGLKSHGSAIRICAPHFSVCVALSAPAARLASRYIELRS